MPESISAAPKEGSLSPRAWWVSALLPVAIILVIEAAARVGLPALHPPALLVPAIVYCAFRWGSRPAMACAAVSWIYLAWSYRGPADAPQQTVESLARVALWAASLPLIALLVGRLRRQVTQATEREALARVRLERDEMVREALTASQTGTWEWRASPDEGSWSPEVNALYGLPPEVSGGPLDRILEQIHPEDRDRVSAEMQAALDPSHADSGFLFEYRTMPVPGQVRWVASRGRVVRDASGTPVRMAGSLTDVTQRKRAELAQQESEQRLRQVIEAGLDAVVVMDAEGRIVYWNHQATAIFGWPVSEAMGLPLAEVIIPPDKRAGHSRGLARYLATGRSTMMQRRLEMDGIRRNGETVPLELSISPIVVGGQILFTGFIRDLTERQLAEAERNRIEARLQESQRLESLGVLAGGIAHDFNNLLTGILGHASLARSELAPGSPLEDSVEAIERAARQLADLCQQMLAYSGRGRVIIEPVDLNRAVEDTLHLVSASLLRSVSVVRRFEEELPAVQADVSQIRQVVMNLVLNAAEAIGEKGGTITVRTGRAELTGADIAAARLPPAGGPGGYLFVEVIDTGAGMTPGVLARMFEPFFTTKFTGRGLGLAAALGIIRGHAGGLVVESAPGAGSRIRVLLPPASQAAKPREEPRPRDSGWRGEGHILVVDDEPTIRETASRILRGLGFEPTVAENGVEALRLLDGNRQGFRLILLDLTMPGPDGVETLQRMRQMGVACPVVLMSGFSPEEVAPRLAGESPPAAYLHKPFTVVELSDTLRAAMEPVS